MSATEPLRHLRASTANKRPTPAAMADGQLALNTNNTSPGLFFKDSNGALVKVGPVHVGTTAPNASPAVGGSTGNAIGEQWLDTAGGTYVFKVWDGSAWRSESGTFVDVNGDVMTGALVMDNQQQVRFRETTANGTNFIAIQAPASVSADRTLTLPDVTGTLVSTGDTGSVTSTMIADGTIVNADINASAAIAGTKISPDFGSQNITTTGTSTSASFTPTSSAVPTNGVYLPAANSVAISTGGSGRLFVDASGNVGVGVSASAWGGSWKTIEFLNGHSFGSAGTQAAVGQNLFNNGSNWIYKTSAPASFYQLNAGEHIWYSAPSGTAGNSVSLLERLRITSAGLVGVGTSAPSNTLHVNSGAVGTSTLLESTGSGSYLGIKNSSGQWTLGATTTSFILENSGGTALTVDSSRRVGIGSTTPRALLDVGGSAAFNAGTYQAPKFAVSNGYIGIKSDAADGVSRLTLIGDSATGDATIDWGGNTNANLIFSNNGSNKARIDSSGRLLVGTSSNPSAGLGQYALAVVQGYAGGTTGEGILSIARGKAATALVNTDTVGQLAFTDNAGNTFAKIVSFVDGTVSSTSDLPGALSFSTTADGASSPTERMRISQNGTVTINGPGGGTFLNLSNSGGYSGFHEVDNTAYTIGQNSDLRAMRIGSGANWLTTGVNLAPGGTSWGTYSDERLKTDIVELTDCLDDIKGIRCVSYRLTDVDDANSKKRIGVIAQDLVGKYDEAINASRRSENDETEYLSVQYSDLIPVLLKALQEASVKIESLESRLTAAGI